MRFVNFTNLSKDSLDGKQEGNQFSVKKDRGAQSVASYAVLVVVIANG